MVDMPAFCVSICGIPVLLNIPDLDIYKKAQDRYRVFVTSHKPVLRVNLRISKQRLSKINRIEPSVSIKDKTIKISRWDMYANINITKRAYATLWQRETTLDSFLRILYTFLLLNKNGFLIHSAGISFGRFLLAFPGLSGSGKSTIVRFFDSKRVFTDELLGIKRVGSKFFAFSTPFWGEFRVADKNKCLPLRCLFFLNNIAPEGIRPVNKDYAVVKIMESILFFAEDVCSSSRLLKIAKDLAYLTKTYELSYNKDRYSFGQLDSMLIKFT
jgi:hypothetical protein